MGMLVGLLALVAGLGSLVCFIIVLIKLFQTEGPLYGILGLICSLYTLIWGWMNADKLNIKNIMLIWTGLIVLGIILPYTISGINSAAFHGLYIHYIVGLWLTPAGYVLIYYFLPISARNPIYAHKLSLVGFWSLALFYPFVGIHHYLYSPIADWAETIAIVTSMLLIIPVWTVLVTVLLTTGSLNLTDIVMTQNPWWVSLMLLWGPRFGFFF